MFIRTNTPVTRNTGCHGAMVPVQILRLSLVDPWMHDKKDGFPLLYIRSHAARLPGR